MQEVGQVHQGKSIEGNEQMASNLNTLSPITVGGRRLPTPQLFTNIPILHCILAEVVDDWLRAVEPYQMDVDAAGTESERLFVVSSGMGELQPSFLKCLFSYAFFFVSADHAYANFYRELNRANNLSGVRIQHRSPPKKSPFVSKIVNIRNISIAHMPSAKAEPINAAAGMEWKPMSLSYPNGGRPDLEKLAFGSGRLRFTDATGESRQSLDLEVEGMKTPHFEHCLPYLEQYDKACCEYLHALQTALDPDW